jgi:hypothetical protein
MAVRLVQMAVNRGCSGKHSRVIVDYAGSSGCFRLLTTRRELQSEKDVRHLAAINSCSHRLRPLAARS